jgi:hypothetical protein
MKETVEDYLRRGGVVKQLKPYLPTKRFYQTATNESRIQAAVKLVKAGNLSDAIAMLR